MPYPTHCEHKLAFDQVRELLLQKCLSELGQQYVHKMRFANRLDVVEKMLQQTNEFKALLTSDTPFPAEHYYNIEPYLNKAAVIGTFLTEDELHQIRLLLNTFKQVTAYFEQRNETYPQLFQLFGGVTVNQTLTKHIERILSDDGKLKPNASPKLAKISADISEKEKEIRKRVNRIFEQASEKGWLADTGITIREGRLVLPVLAEYKRNISGFVHDESATGQTVYIEPGEAFEINNLLRELQIAYKRERERILIEVTDKLRPDLPELYRYMQRMGIADFIRAKALLAIQMNAHLPALSKHPNLKLVNAYHPILKLNHDKLGLQTVPLTIQLTKEKRIVVISGPNAGGKSVCLKTVGLLQYMLQCGLLIPCESHSEVGVFGEIMVDIGDEQSIENDLSTYSSHLKHMKYFTDFADGKTLFLIDEFGTGTDPQFGGPLAESILHRLNQKNAFGVVTTHYSNLKTYASQTATLENASMLFDNQNLIPLYVLEMGKPGSSYAFEIAQKTGLPASVIDYAKHKVGDKQRRVDDLLIELEREKTKLTELRNRAEKKDAEAQKLAADYNLLKQELDANKKKIIQQAKQEALSIISEANSKIEQTIRELREKKAETETIRKVRSELKHETEQLKTDLPEPKKVNAKPQLDSSQIAVGSTVKLSGQSETGEVEELNKGKALVSFGNLRSWIELSRLEPAKADAKTKSHKISPQGLDINLKIRDFKTELNVIGVRGEEAIKQLQVYIDDAFLLGFKQVRIVHGRGYGILRKLIREWLRKSPLIESVTDEHIEMGGDGVTLVTLKVS